MNVAPYLVSIALALASLAAFGGHRAEPCEIEAQKYCPQTHSGQEETMNCLLKLPDSSSVSDRCMDHLRFWLKRQHCKQDAKRFCQTVLDDADVDTSRRSQGLRARRIFDCLRDHKDSLSRRCYAYLVDFGLDSASGRALPAHKQAGAKDERNYAARSDMSETSRDSRCLTHEDCGNGFWCDKGSCRAFK